MVHVFEAEGPDAACLVILGDWEEITVPAPDAVLPFLWAAIK
jgi:hypothetical protein